MDTSLQHNYGIWHPADLLGTSSQAHLFVMGLIVYDNKLQMEQVEPVQSNRTFPGMKKMGSGTLITLCLSGIFSRLQGFKQIHTLNCLLQWTKCHVIILF